MNEFLKNIGKLGKDAISSEVTKMARAFIQKPAVAANIRHLFFPKKIGVYSVQKVEAAEKNADWIVNFFKQSNFHLNRIGIDGLPGSGKSTLAEALSIRLNMKWISLDYQLPEGGVPFDQDLAIYEHHRLLRTQVLDAFDAILFLDLPTKIIKEQIIARGQGALNIELFDFELMQEIGQEAFALAEGEPHQVPGTDLFFKMKPRKGFSLEKTLAEKLITKGFVEFDKLSQEEKLFLLVKGEPRKGLSGYHHGGKYARELFNNILQKVILAEREESKRK